jgi:hypothetical protein
MIHLETAKAGRVCKGCGSIIYTNQICGIVNQEDNYGTKKVSYCKICTIMALEKRRERINDMLKRIRKS